MILYKLKCSDGHHFEAWFKDSVSFDKQAKRGEVECPVCLATTVEKAPMAPAVSTFNHGETKYQQGEQRATRVAKEILKAVGNIQKHVEESCDYVGDKFAEEARAIHYGEAEERGIFGEATEQDALDLVEEDIPVHRIPWRPRKDS